MDYGYHWDVPFSQQKVLVDDGIKLAVQTAGRGPVILLANGIGVRYPGLAPIAHSFYRTHRVVAWDYRGLGDSPVPRGVVNFSMQRQARDALCILDSLGIERAVVLGWSMGVPVGLEMIRLASGRVAGFSALFGSPGRPFHAAAPAIIGDVVGSFVALLKRFPRPAQAALDLATIRPELAFALLRGIQFVGPEADRELFSGEVRGVAAADKRVYFSTMLELARHDARDLLPRIECPVLVVGGGQDWLTPPKAAREMAQAIRGSRLLLLDRASHFGVIEDLPPILSALEQLVKDSFE